RRPVRRAGGGDGDPDRRVGGGRCRAPAGRRGQRRDGHRQDPARPRSRLGGPSPGRHGVVRGGHRRGPVALRAPRRRPEPLRRRLLVIATSRTEDETPELSNTVARLARQRGTTYVALGGLDEKAVGELVAASGADPGVAAARLLISRTGGNALFVRELLSHVSGD